MSRDTADPDPYSSVTSLSYQVKGRDTNSSSNSPLRTRTEKPDIKTDKAEIPLRSVTAKRTQTDGKKEVLPSPRISPRNRGVTSGPGTGAGPENSNSIRDDDDCSVYTTTTTTSGGKRVSLLPT
jgi:hypothetical protein